MENMENINDTIKNMKSLTEENIIDVIKKNDNIISLNELKKIFIFDPWDREEFYPMLASLIKNKKLIPLDKAKNKVSKVNETEYIKII